MTDTEQINTSQPMDTKDTTDPTDPGFDITISCDGDDDALNFEKKVNYKILESCETIKNMLTDMGLDNNTIIPLPIENMYSEAHFDKIIEYCQYMMTPDFPVVRLDGSKIEGDLQQWEKDWIAKMDKQMIFELIMTANYLSNKPFLEMLCKSVAEMIQGKSPDEIREIFNIKNDFTPEEEAEIKKENAFIEEATST